MKSRRIKSAIATLMVAATAVSANSMLISASAAETEQGVVSEQESVKIEFPENVRVCYADDWGMPEVDPANVDTTKRIVISSNDYFALTKDDEVGTPYNENRYKAERNWKDPKTHEQIRPYVWRGYLTEDAKVVCPGVKPNDYFRIGDTVPTKDKEFVLAANGCSMWLTENAELQLRGVNGVFTPYYGIFRPLCDQTENGIGLYLAGGIGTEADPYVFGESVLYDSAVEFEGSPDELHPGDVILSGAELTFNGGWAWDMWISNYAYNIQQDYNSADGDGIKVYLDEDRNCNYCAVTRNGAIEYEEGLIGGNAVVFDDAVNGYHFSQCFVDGETGRITPCQEEETPEVPAETPETPERDNKLDVEFAGNTISLDGDIALNFYTSIKEENLGEDAYMHFVHDGKAVDIPVKESRVTGGYNVFKCRVSAKEMTSDISAQIIDGDRTSDIAVYSIRAYADKMFKDAENNETYAEAVPLVKAMLNYGAYSQIFFGSTAPLANEGLDGTSLDDITAETIGEKTAKTNLPEGVTFEGATLSATSETVVSLFFKSDKELSFKFNGQEITSEKVGGLQCCRIKGVKSNCLDRYLTVSVSNGTEEGTIKYNPMSYCFNTLEKSDDENQCNVVKALFRYSEEAKAYFG